MNKVAIGVVACLFVVGGLVFSYGHGNEVSGEDVFYMISHSEYLSGEAGQVIARLYDWQGDPIDVTNCTVDIMYPDKSYFVQDALTDDTYELTTGTHFYNFVVPSTEGIYQYMVTCNYGANKQQSVANTFHVSPALNIIPTINSSIASLTAQELQHYNDLQANISVINSDLLVITNGINDIKVNLTAIYGDTQYIRNNMLTETLFTANITTVINNQNTMIGQGNNILSNLTEIENFCGSAVTSGSTLCLWVDEINTKVTDINTTVSGYVAILSEINATTHSTYDYMTGTLASNINTLLSGIGRIETNTVQINTTVNEIKQNQQDVVYMEVSS